VTRSVVIQEGEGLGVMVCIVSHRILVASDTMLIWRLSCAIFRMIGVAMLIETMCG